MLRNGQTLEVLETQTRALLHLESKGILTSRVKRIAVDQSPDPELYVLGRDQHSFSFTKYPNKLARLLSFVEGTLMSDLSLADQQHLGLMEDMGAYMGAFDRALEDFVDPTCNPRDCEWEMRYCARTVKDFKGLLPEEKRVVVEEILAYYEEKVHATLEGMPEGFVRLLAIS